MCDNFEQKLDYGIEYFKGDIELIKILIYDIIKEHDNFKGNYGIINTININILNEEIIENEGMNNDKKDRKDTILFLDKNYFKIAKDAEIYYFEQKPSRQDYGNFYKKYDTQVLERKINETNICNNVDDFKDFISHIHYFTLFSGYIASQTLMKKLYISYQYIKKTFMFEGSNEYEYKQQREKIRNIKRANKEANLDTELDAKKSIDIYVKECCIVGDNNYKIESGKLFRHFINWYNLQDTNSEVRKFLPATNQNFSNILMVHYGVTKRKISCNLLSGIIAKQLIQEQKYFADKAESYIEEIIKLNENQIKLEKIIADQANLIQDLILCTKKLDTKLDELYAKLNISDTIVTNSMIPNTVITDNQITDTRIIEGRLTVKNYKKRRQRVDKEKLTSEELKTRDSAIKRIFYLSKKKIRNDLENSEINNLNDILLEQENR